LELPEKANLFEVYGHSKLFINLFTLKLASLLKNKVVVTVDPGNVETKIFRNFPLLSNPVLKVLLWPLRYLTVKTPEQGAQSVLHGILCPKLAPACYIRFLNFLTIKFSCYLFELYLKVISFILGSVESSGQVNFPAKLTIQRQYGDRVYNGQG